MNLVAAGIYWLYLWLTAAPGTHSALKDNYPSIALIEEVRVKFLANLVGVTPDARGLVAGLTIGVRDQVSENLASQMKTLSLTHLVAVSGANLAIVTTAVFFLAAALGLPRNARFFIAAFAMVLYVLLVGPESSVLRAATMASFVMAGFWIGRRVLPSVMLGWAVLLLLAIDPGLSVDYGFSLSVFATFGLLLLAEPIYLKLKEKFPAFLALGLAATIAAQLTTMPILLMLQPSIPIYSVMANLLVEPVVAPVTILGIAATTMVSMLPFLSQLLTFMASLGTWWISFVAAELSQLPFARLPYIPGPLGVGFMTLTVATGAIAILKKGKVRQFAIFGLAISLIIPLGWVATDVIRTKTFSKDWEVLNCDVGQGDALLIRSRNEIALVDVGRDAGLIDSCLSSLGIHTIDLLVLTHYDADHIGGIWGALSGRKVRQALVSGFRDDRPLVSEVKRALAQSGVREEVGYRGLTGRLGKGTWRVLSPTFSAREAEDSNDASLVMSWDFPQFAVLTLADLGERGQSRLFSNVAGHLTWLAQKPLIVKVAHHGSADQSRELYEVLDPEIAILSVGLGNDYGHPTERAIRILDSTGALVLRTDLQGAISIRLASSGLQVSAAGKLSM